MEAGDDAEAVVAACCLLSVAFSACSLIESSITGPRVTPPTIDWVLPFQSLIMKMPYMFACTLIFGSIFPIEK